MVLSIATLSPRDLQHTRGWGKLSLLAFFSVDSPIFPGSFTALKPNVQAESSELRTVDDGELYKVCNLHVSEFEYRLRGDRYGDDIVRLCVHVSVEWDRCVFNYDPSGITICGQRYLSIWMTELEMIGCYFNICMDVVGTRHSLNIIKLFIYRRRACIYR